MKDLTSCSSIPLALSCLSELSALSTRPAHTYLTPTFTSLALCSPAGHPPSNFLMLFLFSTHHPSLPPSLCGPFQSYSPTVGKQLIMGSRGGGKRFCDQGHIISRGRESKRASAQGAEREGNDGCKGRGMSILHASRNQRSTRSVWNPPKMLIFSSNLLIKKSDIGFDSAMTYSSSCPWPLCGSAHFPFHIVQFIK